MAVDTPGRFCGPNKAVASVGPSDWPQVANAVALNSATVANNGGSQAHENMQPYLTLSYCIALIQAIFPSPN